MMKWTATLPLVMTLLLILMPTPSAAEPTRWPDKRLYVVVQEGLPYPIARTPAPAWNLALETPAFEVNSRFQPPQRMKALFEALGLASPPSLAALSTLLSGQESIIERNLIPQLERWGVPAPLYETFVTAGNERRLLIFADDQLEPADVYAEYGTDCAPDAAPRFAQAAIAIKRLPTLDTPERLFNFRLSLTHELLHGSQKAGGRCSQAEWVREGGPQGFAMQAIWKTGMTEKLVAAINETNDNFALRRSYAQPLDLDVGDRLRLVKANETSAADAAAREAALAAQARRDAYGTGSFFQYLLEATDSPDMALDLFLQSGNSRQALYDLLERGFTAGAEHPVSAAEAIAAFFTEYASWGGGRYKVGAAENPDGSYRLLSASVAGDETRIRNQWLTQTFECSEQPDVTMTANRATADATVLLRDVMPLSGRCLKVAWRGIASPVRLQIQLLVATDAQASSLILGDAYVQGAALNAPPYAYCYQNLTDGGGSFGEPIENRRGHDAAVDKCLHRVTPFESVTLDGVSYRAATFETKFHVGKAAGEAVFIITNAAPKAGDNKRFDVRARVMRMDPRFTWKSGTRYDEGEESGIWSITGNHGDAQFGAAVHASRDLRPDDEKLRSGLANLARLGEDGATTFLGVGEHFLQLIDNDEGLTAVLMSADGNRIAVGGAGGSLRNVRECGLTNQMTVQRRDAAGLTFGYDADILDLPTLMQAVAASPGGDQCTAVRQAVVDRVTADIHLPDGRMHIAGGDIRRVYPEGYDKAVRASLNSMGVADNGGLPLRRQQSTFLTGMPGSAPGYSPPVDLPDLPKASRRGSAAPEPAEAEATVCRAGNVIELIQRLDGIANPCNCSCAGIRGDRTALQAGMQAAMGAMTGDNACTTKLGEAMGKASERIQACLLGACSAMLGRC